METNTPTRIHHCEDGCHLLWVEMQSQIPEHRLSRELAADFAIHVCQTPAIIPTLISELQPAVICFEFDQPGATDLRVLRGTKLNYPSLPILMLSDPPTAELALWALRTRVWDYFVKPATAGEIARRINILGHVSRTQRTHSSRAVFMPQQVLPDDETLLAKPAPSKSTAAVANYLEKSPHIHLTLADAAARCAMGPYEFSREFKREHGMTFRDFVIQKRVTLAAERLRADNAVIMDIALEAGFNDASHFTRTFRRHVGLTPTAYRLLARQAAGDCAIAAMPEGDWDNWNEDFRHSNASAR